MGHVGNKLGFEMLALHPLIHGPADAVADAVQVVGVVQQVAVHVFGVDGIVHVALGDFGRPGAKPFHAQQQVHQQCQQQHPLHKPAEELCAGGMFGGADKDKLDQQNRRHNKAGAAQQGQAVDKGTEQSADLFQQVPAPAKDPVDQAAFDHAFQLYAGGKAHQEQGQQQLDQHKDHQQPQQIGKGKTVCHFNAQGDGAEARKSDDRREQIKGDAVDEVRRNGIAAVPVSCGAHQKYKQQDRHDQHGQGDGDQLIAQVVGPLKAVQREADIVGGHTVLQNIALHGADHRRFLLCFLLCSRFILFTARFRGGRCCGNRRYCRCGGVFRQGFAQV